MTDDLTKAPIGSLGNGGSRPVPDPTERTDRAIARLEQSLTQYIDSQLEIRDQRLRGIDEATKLHHATIPGVIGNAVNGLEKLMDEKFDAAERLRVEQKKDTKDAVDAALNAAKEAVKEQTASSEKSITKSELATGKQIEQLQGTFNLSSDGLRKSIDDLKERENEDVRVLRQSITDVSTVTNGQVQQKVGAKEDRQGLYAAAGVVLAILAFIAGRGGL